MSNKKGEIATILTIGSLVVLGLTSLASTVFLKKTIKTQPRASSCSVPPPPSELTGSCSASGTEATISWNSVPGAKAYGLRIDDKSNDWTNRCDQVNAGDACFDNLTTTSHTFPTTPGHSYSWWVHSVNDCGWSDSDRKNAFIICPSSTSTETITEKRESLNVTGSCSVPPPPSELTGSCSASGTEATISWNSVPGAKAYGLRIDDKSNDWTNRCDQVNAGDACFDNLTTTSHTFPTTPGHSYSWWVHSVNDCGWSDSDRKNAFIICPSSTSTSTLLPGQGDCEEGKRNTIGACDPACCDRDDQCPSNQLCNISNGGCRSGLSCNPNSFIRRTEPPNRTSPPRAIQPPATSCSQFVVSYSPSIINAGQTFNCNLLGKIVNQYTMACGWSKNGSEPQGQISRSCSEYSCTFQVKMEDPIDPKNTVAYELVGYDSRNECRTETERREILAVSRSNECTADCVTFEVPAKFNLINCQKNVKIARIAIVSFKLEPEEYKFENWESREYDPQSRIQNSEYTFYFSIPKNPPRKVGFVTFLYVLYPGDDYRLQWSELDRKKLEREEGKIYSIPSDVLTNITKIDEIRLDYDCSKNENDNKIKQYQKKI